MLTRARTAVLVLAGLTLAACSSVHPGAAATVDGQTISMKTLNDTAKIYCQDNLNEAKRQGVKVKAVSNTDLNRSAVVASVTYVVARDLAKKKDLHIKPSSYEVPDSDRAAVAKAFPGVDVDTAISVIEHSRETAAIFTALGEAATGQKASPETQDQIARAGQLEVQKAFADADVQFAPRFGLSPSGKPRGDTGSLSVAPVDLEAPSAEELPDTQRCS